MITTAPARDNQECAKIITSLMDNFYMNQLIIADIHAPMNQLSDIFKIVEKGKIIGGWTLFHGFDIPLVTFPPNIPQAWPAIQNFVSALGYDQIYLPFPKNVLPPVSERPWENWSNYSFSHLFTDMAMRLGGSEIEVRDISNLPKIRGASVDDEAALTQFFDAIKETDPDYSGFWHPMQLQSDLYVVAEDDDQSIVAVAGSHFETPISVQIGNIYVKPQWRGQGIGRAITTAVVLGIARFKLIPTLFVNKNNKTAQKLYQSIGFEEYNQFEFYEGKRN